LHKAWYLVKYILKDLSLNSWANIPVLADNGFIHSRTYLHLFLSKALLGVKASSLDVIAVFRSWCWGIFVEVAVASDRCWEYSKSAKE
jgi:hypothetical protein